MTVLWSSNKSILDDNFLQDIGRKIRGAKAGSGLARLLCPVGSADVGGER